MAKYKEEIIFRHGYIRCRNREYDENFHLLLKKTRLEDSDLNYNENEVSDFQLEHDA